jgi:tRNA threonylcarbamoyladenosine biosynthesis protein TsaE
MIKDAAFRPASDLSAMDELLRSRIRVEDRCVTSLPAYEVETRSGEETRALGERLAGILRPGDVLLLQGDLGAGKTTLTQGIARGLGIEDYVQSPTFILVAEYDGRAADGTPLRLYHLDLYRLEGASDLESIGLGDYLEPSDGISVVEWPERASDELPDDHLLVRIELADGERRRITLRGTPESGDLTRRIAALSPAKTH